MTGRGSKPRTWTQISTLQPDQRVVKVLSALKSLNKLCAVLIIIGSVEDAEIESNIYLFPTLISQYVEGYITGYVESFELM